MRQSLCKTWHTLSTTTFPAWSAAPDSVQLPASGELHGYLLTLDQPPECVQALHRLLAADEQQRAAHFYTQMLQSRFIVGRGMLRWLLGEYLNQPPQAIQLTYGERGKPALPDHPLQFNLAHSEGLALYGFMQSSTLGVDLEAVHPLPDMELVARSHFSPVERHDLFSLPATEQTTAFYRCWTRKEAYIKAESSGLYLPLDSFDVTLLPDDPVRIRRIGTDPHPDRRWSLLHLPISPEFQAAAACSGDIPIVHYWLL